MKKTLLFYINTIRRSGAERVIIQLAHHFAEAGYRSVLVTSFTDENFEYPVPDGVIRISIEERQRVQSRIMRNFTRIAALRRIVKKESPLAVISFMAEPNFRAFVATRGLAAKLIVSVRNDPNREYGGKIGEFVGKHLITRADGCVFQTEDAKKWFPKYFQKKSKVIFNDVNKKFFETHWTGGKDVVTLGRLSPQKNQKLLIHAFKNTADKYPERNLLIYGAGILENELQEEIERLGMSKRIMLMGETKNAADVYSSSGIFVLSSDYEGMPNALLEALAVGVPSISTDCPCGGPRAVIQNGKNGILVPVNDECALTKALDRLMGDYEYAKKLGSCAKENAQEYNTEKVFAQWKEYIESVIQQ